MKFLDLFAGIGGFRRGLERSGHECIGHVENDKYANKSYMAMYELVICPYWKDTSSNSCKMCQKEVQEQCDSINCKGEWYAKDITKIRAREIPKAEIWTFGFPCTDISIAGRMEGLRGSRSGLFFTVIGLLESQSSENRPKWLIIENVKHLLSSDQGGAFTTVLFELWKVGYNAEWQTINSKCFGVPQHRERVYIVGYLGRNSGRTIFPIGRSNTTLIKQLIGGKQGNRVYDINGLSVTLTAEGGGFAGRTGLYTTLVNRKEGLKNIKEDAYSLTVSNIKKQNKNESQNTCLSEISSYSSFIDLNTNSKLTETARCLRARQYSGIGNHRGESSGVLLCHGNTKCVMAVLTPNRREKRQNGRRIKQPGEACFTLTTQDQHGILLCCCKGWKEGLPICEAKKYGLTTAYSGDGMNHTYPNSTKSHGCVGKQCSQTLHLGGSLGVCLCCRIRRLTPRECWRLQAFKTFCLTELRQSVSVILSSIVRQGMLLPLMWYMKLVCDLLRVGCKMRFKVIYADPPWAYKVYSKKGVGRSAENHYHTMSVEDIYSLDVAGIADKDCVLFLWVTFPCLLQGIETLKQWGFEYKTLGFCWVKRNRKQVNKWFWGLGFWTISNPELCLIATKGKPKRVSAAVHCVVDTPIEQHSKKPDEVRRRIEQLLGDVTRVELFARKSYDHWVCLGDEINGMEIHEAIVKLKETEDFHAMY